MKDNVGLIIEGLSSVRLDEGTSSFSSKLNSFIKSEGKDVQDNIKKVLNAIFMYYKKKYDGYVEGKVEQKNKGSYKTLTMEFTTNKMFNDVGALTLMTILLSLKPLKFEVGTLIPYDGYVYTACLIDGDDKKIESDEYSPNTNTIVGLDCRHDRDSEGYMVASTLRVIVSIPIKKT